MTEMTINLEMNDDFLSAWKKIMHSHWWGGGLWWLKAWKKDVLPLTYAEKEALAKLLIQLQPQVNSYRDDCCQKANQ